MLMYSNKKMEVIVASLLYCFCFFPLFWLIKTWYSQLKMRSRLVDCIERVKMTLFSTHNSRIPDQNRTKKASIYCICRLPEADSVFSEWYHLKCITVPSRHVWNRELEWQCKPCRSSVQLQNCSVQLQLFEPCR